MLHSSIIKAYGDSWESAGKIQDGFQKTVNLGQIPSLEALASAMPRVTAVAADLKVSQEELNSVFATASGVMGKPAEVATQLNAVLSAMLKPGAEAVKMANSLGIAFNADSIQKSGGLKNYLDVLMPKIKAFSDRTGRTQQEIIGHLFGSQEAIKLVIGLGGKLSESFGDNTEKIKNSTGAVQAAFDIMQVTTNSKVKLMRNSFSNAMDGIFVALAPLLHLLIDGTAKIFQFIRGFIEAHPVLSKFLIITTAVAGSVIFMGMVVSLASLKMKALYLSTLKASLSSNIFTASIAKASLAGLSFLKTLWRMTLQLGIQAVQYALTGAAMLGSFITGLITATAAQWGLNIALNANPIGLIVIGIAAAVGAIALMIKHWDKIKMVIVKFAKFLWDINPFKILIDVADKIFPGFKQKIVQVFDYVKSFVFSFWEKIKKVINKVKEFFGFGDTNPEIDVNVKNPDGSPVVTDPTNNSSGLLIAPDAPVISGNSFQGGATGSGKSITMTLDIKNVFNISGSKMKESIEDIADEIVGKINDRMRDAAIASD